MEENKNTQENQVPVEESKEKTGLFGKIRSKFKKEKTPATPNGEASDIPKKTLGQKIKDNKGKIAGTVAVAAAVGFGVMKILANRSNEGEIDPDDELEPGDWDELEELENLESGETSDEEVTEE